MFAKRVIAASALLAVVAAVPLNKRDIVWVTEIAEDIVTIPVTKTVWVTPGEVIPTEASSHFGHHFRSTIHVQSTMTVPAATPSSPAESSPAAAPSSETSSSSSVYVAPTTSSVYVAPISTALSSTWVAPTTSSSASAAASSSAASSSSSSDSITYGPGAAGTSYTGDLTWYQTGLGACGITSTPSDHIVAISEVIYDAYDAEAGSDPNNNPMCGKTVTITGVDGSPYTATVVDRCTGCDEESLDLSEDFFNMVTNYGNGRVYNISWKFNN